MNSKQYNYNLYTTNPKVSLDYHAVYGNNLTQSALFILDKFSFHFNLDRIRNRPKFNHFLLSSSLEIVVRGIGLFILSALFCNFDRRKNAHELSYENVSREPA